MLRLIETLAVRIVLDTAAAAHFLVDRKITHARSVLHAYSDFIKMRPAFKHKRKENLEKTIQPKLSQQYSGSILMEYYLRKKKKFSDIFNSEHTL